MRISNLVAEVGARSDLLFPVENDCPDYSDTRAVALLSRDVTILMGEPSDPQRIAACAARIVELAFQFEVDLGTEVMKYLSQLEAGVVSA